jgi:hypothetical protein
MLMLMFVGFFYVRRPCSGIADKYFFFLLGLRPLHISCVGGLSPISISGEYSGKRSMSAGSSGSNFVGFGSEPVYVHLVCVDRSKTQQEEEILVRNT